MQLSSGLKTQQDKKDKSVYVVEDTVQGTGGDVFIYRNSTCWGVYARAGEKEIVLI